MSSLIKKIKIKKQDGTFTDYIPIGAEAENVNVDGESVEVKLNKTPYYYNSVDDMKVDEKLKVGDMAITLGYYEPNDGGGAEYKIENTKNIIKIQEELENKLLATLIIKDKVNIKQLGAYGDDNHDDTQIIQAAFDFIKNNGYPLYLPDGIYKVTSPIRLEWKSDLSPARPNLFEMYGNGGSLTSTSKGSIIKGYNLSSEQAILELIGNGNTWGARCNFHDFVILQDSITCNELSFCFKLGDTYKSMLNNIRMRGYNDLLLRCGTTTQGSSWGNISLRFTSCTFAIFNDYAKGFSILPERILTNIGQPSDNLLFESCNFNGIVCIDVATAKFIACMEALVDKEISTDNPGILNGIAINYGTSYLVVGAKNLELDNCYFEDFIVGVQLYPLFESVYNVTINNCYFNGITNMIKDGNRVISDNAILSSQNPNHTGWINTILNVNNCTFRSKSTVSDYGFTDAEISNYNTKYLNVTNYTNMMKDDTPINIKDNYSRYSKIVKHDFIPVVYEAKIENLKNYTNAFKFDNDVDFIKILNKKSIEKIELFFDTSMVANSFTFALKDTSDTVLFELGSSFFEHTEDNKYWISGNLNAKTGNYITANYPIEIKPTLHSATFSEMIGAKVNCKITFGE